MLNAPEIWGQSARNRRYLRGLTPLSAVIVPEASKARLSGPAQLGGLGLELHRGPLAHLDLSLLGLRRAEREDGDRDADCGCAGGDQEGEVVAAAERLGGALSGGAKRSGAVCRDRAERRQADCRGK